MAGRELKWVEIPFFAQTPACEGHLVGVMENPVCVSFAGTFPTGGVQESGEFWGDLRSYCLQFLWLPHSPTRSQLTTVQIREDPGQRQGHGMMEGREMQRLEFLPGKKPPASTNRGRT